jgi:hypothetical protein
MKIKNNKATSVWQKLSANMDFKKMVKAHREKFSVPENGFKSGDDYKKWRGELLKNKDTFNESILSEIKVVSYDCGLDTSGLYQAIKEFLYFEKVMDITLNSANTTGCAIYFIDRDNIDEIKGRIIRTDDIIIKIGKNSRPTDINLFLKQQKNSIELFQKKIREENLEAKQTKFKQIKLSGRDHLVCYLYNLDIKELQKIAGAPKASRDILVSRVIKRQGLKIEPENVRQVVRRKNIYYT